MSRSPALRRGDLAIYDMDPHRVAAENLYIVLGAGGLGMAEQLAASYGLAPPSAAP